MKHEPLFLSPVFKERLWGGQRLKETYNYQLPYQHTGEAWVISAHPHGPNRIENGPLKGKTLIEAWEQHGDLFNRQATCDQDYPLLVKILDAEAKLAVQVHPDDQYARENDAEPYGKEECWYILAADQGAEIILGHEAKTHAQLDQLIDQADWDALLSYHEVKKGDFIYVPSGTIHALGAGMMVLEIQQSSDITYRLYDYDRIDRHGNKNALHLEQSKAVAHVPHVPYEVTPTTTVNEDLTIKRLVESAYFTVEHLTLAGQASVKMEQDFLQVSVIKGEGQLELNEKSYSITKGQHFILPYGIDRYNLAGELELIVSYP